MEEKVVVQIAFSFWYINELIHLPSMYNSQTLEDQKEMLPLLPAQPVFTL